MFSKSFLLAFVRRRRLRRVTSITSHPRIPRRSFARRQKDKAVLEVEVAVLVDPSLGGFGFGFGFGLCSDDVARVV